MSNRLEQLQRLGGFSHEEYALHQAQQRQLDEATILASKLQRGNIPIDVKVPQGFEGVANADELNIRDTDIGNAVVDFIDEVVPEINDNDVSGMGLSIMRLLFKVLKHPIDDGIPSPAEVKYGQLTPDDIVAGLEGLKKDINISLLRTDVYISR